VVTACNAKLEGPNGFMEEKGVNGLERSLTSSHIGIKYGTCIIAAPGKDQDRISTVISQ
jgi:hypothetical protein